MRLAMNYQETEINQKKVLELARLEQQLVERLQEHTKKQMKVQEEYQSLLGVSQMFGSQQQPPNSQRPGTTATMISKPMVTSNNTMRGISQGRMRSTSNGFPKTNRVPATLNNYFASSNKPIISSNDNIKVSLINSSQQNDSQPRINIKNSNFDSNPKVPPRQVHTSSIQNRPKIVAQSIPQQVQAKPAVVLNSQIGKAKEAVQKQESYDDDYEDDFATVETSKVQGRKSPPIVVNNITQPKKQSPVQSKSSTGSMRYSQGGSPQNNVHRILKPQEGARSSQNDDYEDDYEQLQQESQTANVHKKQSNPNQLKKLSKASEQESQQHERSLGSHSSSQQQKQRKIQLSNPKPQQKAFHLEEDSHFERDEPDKQDIPRFNENIHLEEAKRNINPKALLSGNSDQNADSEEYQEINDRDLEDFEQKYSAKNAKKPNQKQKQKSAVKPQKLTSTQKAKAQAKQMPHQNDQPKTDLQRMIEEGQLRNFEYDDDEDDEELDYQQNNAAQGHTPVNNDEDDEYNEYAAAVESQRRAMQQNANGGRESPKFGQQSDGGDEYEDDYEN